VKRVYLAFLVPILVFGAGCSAPAGTETAEENMIRADLAGFAREAAAYAETAGEDTALAEFNDEAGRFTEGALYVYAYDYNGTLLAHPHLQDSIGTSLIERQDPYAMKNIRALCDTAEPGGGFIVFIRPNPAQENHDELKIGYVVDDTWWVGGRPLGDHRGEWIAPLPGTLKVRSNGRNRL
jgi:hypothetical protein